MPCATAPFPCCSSSAVTVFVQGERGFSVRQVSWECEAQYEMPVTVWNDLTRMHYPNAGWVRLGHDTVAALAA